MGNGVLAFETSNPIKSMARGLGNSGFRPIQAAEARVGRFAPEISVWNDCDGVPLALVFAQEHGAGLEAPRSIQSRLVAPCEAVEMLCGLRIKRFARRAAYRDLSMLILPTRGHVDTIQTSYCEHFCTVFSVAWA